MVKDDQPTASRHQLTDLCADPGQLSAIKNDPHCVRIRCGTASGLADQDAVDTGDKPVLSRHLILESDCDFLAET
jgi:hypothetical protein